MWQNSNTASLAASCSIPDMPSSFVRTIEGMPRPVHTGLQTETTNNITVLPKNETNLAPEDVQYSFYFIWMFGMLGFVCRLYKPLYKLYKPSFCDDDFFFLYKSNNWINFFSGAPVVPVLTQGDLKLELRCIQKHFDQCILGEAGLGLAWPKILLFFFCEDNSEIWGSFS